MSTRLRLEVVTGSRRLLEIDVEEVQFPGGLGCLGVLPGHTPLLTTLGIGALTYRTGRDTHQLVVAGGFAEVLPGSVTLLADRVEVPDEIDAEAARADQRAAEESLHGATPETLDALMDRVRLAEARLEVAARSEV